LQDDLVAEAGQKKWETYRQIRHITLYRPILPLEIQQIDALLLVKWILQGMIELEIHERTFQGVLLEVDSLLSRTVTRTHRLHLVNPKGSAHHHHLQGYMIGISIERGIHRGDTREGTGSSLVET